VKRRGRVSGFLAEPVLSGPRLFAEFTLSGVRFFLFTSFRVRMTESEELRMTRSEGFRMKNRVVNTGIN